MGPTAISCNLGGNPVAPRLTLDAYGVTLYGPIDFYV